MVILIVCGFSDSDPDSDLFYFYRHAWAGLHNWLELVPLHGWPDESFVMVPCYR